MLRRKHFGLLRDGSARPARCPQGGGVPRPIHVHPSRRPPPVPLAPPPVPPPVHCIELARQPETQGQTAKRKSLLSRAFLSGPAEFGPSLLRSRPIRPAPRRIICGSMMKESRCSAL